MLPGGLFTMQWKWKCAGLLVVVLTATGCPKVLNQVSDFELKLGDEKKLTVEAITKEQKVKVALTADVPVNVYMFLEKDATAAESDINKKKLPSTKVLAMSEKTNDATLEATVPANNAVVVFITSAGKTANVKVKITN
jgi:hypothetical protein